MSHLYTCDFILQSDWCHQMQASEVDNFSLECHQALYSPFFLSGEPGHEAILRVSSTLLSSSIGYRNREVHLTQEVSSQLQCGFI